MTTGFRPAWALMTTAAVLAALLVTLAPAHAVPPANDAISGAIEIPTEPSTREFDTSEATADPADGECVGDKSVWFRFEATETRRMRMTTAGSDFNTRLAIFRGTRNQRELVDCDNNRGPGKTSAEQFRIRAGQRYWIAVSSCCEPDDGGNAVLTVGRVESPGAEVEIVGARAGGISGRLLVDGTITCATPSEVRLRVVASQRVDDAVARGTGFRRIRSCDEESSDWTVRIDSETGWAFAPGPVSVAMRGSVYDGIASAGFRDSASPEADLDPAARTTR